MGHVDLLVSIYDSWKIVKTFDDLLCFRERIKYNLVRFNVHFAKILEFMNFMCMILLSLEIIWNTFDVGIEYRSMYAHFTKKILKN